MPAASCFRARSHAAASASCSPNLCVRGCIHTSNQASLAPCARPMRAAAPCRSAASERRRAPPLHASTHSLRACVAPHLSRLIPAPPLHAHTSFASSCASLHIPRPRSKPAPLPPPNSYPRAYCPPPPESRACVSHLLLQLQMHRLELIVLGVQLL